MHDSAAMDCLFADPPLDILWEVTGKCHLTCRHCAATEHAPTWSPSLTLEQISQVVAHLTSTRKLNVALAGGERVALHHAAFWQ
jgi:MoaA/NifB/PqqE/SkfB family radical SAM enzyme